MNKKEQAEELVWIYRTLKGRSGAYLLENVVDEAKSYAASDVHTWGAQEEHSQQYEKIKDLIKVRIFEAVEEQKLDKQLASEILKTYYYKPFSDAGDKTTGNVIKVEILQLEAGV